MIVVDSNIAVAWSIRGDRTDAANLLLRRGIPLIAPDLIIAEVTNAMFRLAQNFPEHHDQVRISVEMIPRWFDRLIPSTELRRKALQLALELRHPAYDCFFLAAAIQNDALLVTLDVPFLKRVIGAGFDRHIVHLADWRP
jgi:predicted nucleic acid-binding protein